MERSKKGNLQLSKTTLTSLSGGGYKYTNGRATTGFTEKVTKYKGKGGSETSYDGEIIPKAGLGKGKFAGKDYFLGKGTSGFTKTIFG